MRFLTQSRDRLELQFLFKEMKWDIDMESNDIVEVTTGTDTLLGNVPMRINIDGHTLNGHIVFNSGGDTSVEASVLDGYTIIPDSDELLTNSGTISGWKLWDGNGYGDDEQFQMVDYISNRNDDNSNLVLYGQKAVRLPYFIKD